MRALARLTNGLSATVLAVSTLIPLAVGGMAHATAQNCTWTGGTDLNFSTAANWSNCGGGTPLAGDNLVFDVSGLSAYKTLNNDMTGLSVGNITFQGSNANNNGYTIKGNKITLGGNITAAQSGYVEVDANIALGGNTTINNTGDIGLDGVISGTGNITKTGTGALYLGGTNTFVGNTTANGGVLDADAAAALGPANSNKVTVNDGASFQLGGCSPFTFPNDLTLTGASSVPSGNQVTAKLGALGICAGGGGGADETYGLMTANGAGYTFSGNITLGSDVTFMGLYDTTTISGALSGNYKLTVPGISYGGSLVISSSNNTSGIANGTYAPPTVVKTLSDDQSSHTVDIEKGATITIDGKRGDTMVSGGELKGTGQVYGLTALNNSVVAPGHSPGTLTVETLLDLEKGSTYQAELKDTAAGDYDQLVVGKASDTSGNDVKLGDSTQGYPTLDVELYSGYKIKAGDQFTIINNLSKTDVSGQFNNLPEGATFKAANGSVFKISYKGGDGNDVVLTVLTAPTTPDTGFAIASAHPGVTLGAVVLTAGMIFGLAHKASRKPVPARAQARR